MGSSDEGRKELKFLLMKPKAKAVKPSTRRSRKAKRPAGAKPSVTGAWRMSDLPLHLQVELRDAIEQAKRGEGLQDFDEAIAEGDRLSDEMLSILARDPHHPAE
jgi:hypothetical protein